MATQRVRKAVIPAAGMGTRFLPATKAQPKEMLPIVDTPTIQLVVEEAVRSGIEDILIVTGRGKRAIEDHFDRSVELEEVLRKHNKQNLLATVRDISNLVDVHFVRQKEPLGLGHAVLCARRHVGNEPFAVLLGDDIVDAEQPCLAQLLDVHHQRGGSVLAVQEVEPDRVDRYGVIFPREEGNGLYAVEDLIEKPSPSEAPSRLGVVGRYVLEPVIFDLLASLPPGVGGEIQLTDALRRLSRQQPLYALAFTGQRYDVGEKFGYIQATIDYALKRPELRAELLPFLRETVERLDAESMVLDE